MTVVIELDGGLNRGRSYFSVLYELVSIVVVFVIRFLPFLISTSIGWSSV
jgi:hypothetical protein